MSFGPINHPDAAQYYVGYPYQFWINNTHFIDGGLHQGLLSVADFSNIIFFKENTTWLIRSIQALPFILIYFLFKDGKTSLLISSIFFSSLVIVQWVTIGKTMFFGEACLAVNYLCWIKQQNPITLLNLIMVMFCVLAFKISALLVLIPISINLLIFLFSKVRTKNSLNLFVLNFIYICFAYYFFI